MTRDVSPTHVKLDDLPWSDYSAWYPKDMMDCMRAKRIVGPGGMFESEDTLFGFLEIDPGGVYPPHRHPAAEIYFVVSGAAECRFGEDVFEASAGSIIHTKPNVIHEFRTLGEEPFRAFAYWYGQDGRTEDLRGDLELITDR